MDLLMQRTEVSANGCFSTISTPQGVGLFVGAEHAYQQPDGSWLPKIPAGLYTCQRGSHKLADLVPFETFEVLGVPGHVGILFHKGNLPERDSDGCILLGTSFSTLEGAADVANSGLAFQAFMSLQQGLDQFQLTVL